MLYGQSGQLHDVDQSAKILIIILSFRVGTSKNNNIDHQETRAQVTYETNHSTMSYALYFCFICISLWHKEKYPIRSNINFQIKGKVCMWNQYCYYFDLPKIRAGGTRPAKKSCVPLRSVHISTMYLSGNE